MGDTSSGGKRTALKQQLTEAKINLDYAKRMVKQFGKELNYTNSDYVRTKYDDWSKELTKATKAYEKVEKKINKRKKNSNIPF